VSTTQPQSPTLEQWILALRELGMSDQAIIRALKATPVQAPHEPPKPS
jgi:hypothetical protein